MLPDLTKESAMTSGHVRPGGDRELKVHDGIVGTLVLLSVVASVTVNPAWLWLAGVISVAMIQSALTGFCPLHFVLSKVMPATD